jgi:hypothetical protein
MHLVLARHLNKRLIELHSTTKGETIGVLRRDGTYEYRQWLGFIDRVQARKLGKPVKLQVSRVGSQGEFHIDWRDVSRGRHVQGCLTRTGVYAVADWGVRVI